MTRVLASVNLFGLVGFDGPRVVRAVHHGALCNGMCVEGDRIYLADWSDVLVLDPSGRFLERIRTKAQNCHTLRRHGGRFLMASTADGSVVWGDEAVFHPRRSGFRPAPPHGYYVNAAIPWRDDTVLVSLRSHRAVVLFDLKSRRVERTIPLPFMRNLHHPTPYGPDLFLASDDSSVVMFDAAGKPVLRSPEMRWPRGISVEGRTRVWVADRRGVRRWNPQSNAIECSIDFPNNPPSSLPERKGDVPAGAGFDVVAVQS